MRASARAGVVAVAMVLLLALAVPAFAEHSHWLQTPGACVTDIASGQTSLADGGGYHRFHNNVHIGTAGAALADTGQVAVGKSDTGDCP